MGLVELSRHLPLPPGLYSRIQTPDLKKMDNPLAREELLRRQMIILWQTITELPSTTCKLSNSTPAVEASLIVNPLNFEGVPDCFKLWLDAGYLLGNKNNPPGTRIIVTDHDYKRHEGKHLKLQIRTGTPEEYVEINCSIGDNNFLIDTDWAGFSFDKLPLPAQRAYSSINNGRSIDASLQNKQTMIFMATKTLPTEQHSNS